MIKEAYCSYEVAKLLKEKGFNEPIRCWYDSAKDFHERGGEMRNSDCISPTIMCPTHQMAMKWLREAHGIFILIKPYDSYYDDKYEFSIYKKQNTVIFEWELLEIENSLYEGYEETVEAALKYSLENLI